MDVRTPDEPRYRFGPFLLDPAKRLLTRDGAPIALTYRVIETLLVFVRNPGRTLTKDKPHEAIRPGRYIVRTVPSNARRPSPDTYDKRLGILSNVP